MLIALIVIALLGLSFYLFMKSPVFGDHPSGARLEKIIQSANYQNGAFQNPEPTEVMRKEASFFKIMIEFFNKPKSTRAVLVPTVKTDLKNLTAANPVIVWFGHSSYLIKTSVANILVDPVLKGNVAPVSFFGKPFPGADAYSVEDLPSVDVVILTHDHYDHLHYQSIQKLASTAKYFCTSMGVGAHLERWGVRPDQIIELNWGDQKTIIEGLTLTATPARHFSGRSFARGKTLWSSFVLQLPDHTLFLGGDSGYGAHFKAIGEKFGPFDLAILECGQYGANWPSIHMLPEETVQAGIDLQAKTLLPVHWAKFELAMHPWNEPIQRFVKAADERGIPYTTPLIGEPVEVNARYPKSVWWNN